MKPVERSITLLLAFVALVKACRSDRGVVGPRASTRLTADAAEEQPQYGSWSAPVNLGPVINTAANEQHPAISKDGLSLYISSDRPGGFGGTDIWVSQRACTDADDAACAWQDRKSTRLNSSHGYISYAVFCLKKKNELHARSL